MANQTLHEKLLTSAQARSYLAISDGTLKTLVHAGVLSACRVGRQLRFRAADIEHFLDARRITVQAG